MSNNWKIAVALRVVGLLLQSLRAVRQRRIQSFQRVQPSIGVFLTLCQFAHVSGSPALSVVHEFKEKAEKGMDITVP